MTTKLSITDIPDSNFKNKRVFVRVDFNVPIKDGYVVEDYRIRQAVPTIKYLISRQARVILASHMGRPKGKKVDKLSLKPVALRLGEILGKEVKFAGEVIGDNVSKIVDEQKNGEVLLLENLRFYKEETDNDPGFSEQLAKLADIYVDDAFGTCHRAHASTNGMTKHFDVKVAGLLIEKELRYLGPLINDPKRPYLVIVGGAKIKDKISALKNMMEKADLILIGGCVAYTFLAAKGINTGKSLVEDAMIPWAKEAMKEYGDKILLPSDHLVANNPDDIGSIIVTENEIPENMMGFDIGPETVSDYVSHVSVNGTIFWNGPMGYFEVDEFANGTTKIAKSVAEATKNGVKTVVGGGDSVAALQKAGLSDTDVRHLSTGGGATLEFLGGTDLPGISVLTDK